MLKMSNAGNFCTNVMGKQIIYLLFDFHKENDVKKYIHNYL